MTLWIDGDSIPRSALLAALEAGKKHSLPVHVVADRTIADVESTGGSLITLPHGLGGTDAFILDRAVAEDIVVTRDIKLALEIRQREITVMNHRGKVWSLRDLKARVVDGDLMRAFRNSGQAARGSRTYGPMEARSFAEALEGILENRTGHSR